MNKKKLQKFNSSEFLEFFSFFSHFERNKNTWNALGLAKFTILNEFFIESFKCSVFFPIETERLYHLSVNKPKIKLLEIFCLVRVDWRCLLDKQLHASMFNWVNCNFAPFFLFQVRVWKTANRRAYNKPFEFIHNLNELFLVANTRDQRNESHYSCNVHRIKTTGCSHFVMHSGNTFFCAINAFHRLYN